MSKVNASWNRNDIQDLSSINQEQEDKIKRGINQAFDKWAYNQIMDEAYKNYYTFMRDDRQWELDKEEFINKCKTDTEFSEKWGLKIEERELSDEESIFHYEKELYSPLRIIDPKIPVMPTKLITITYNDKTIESYE
jgi:hypothetical protein